MNPDRGLRALAVLVFLLLVATAGRQALPREVPPAVVVEADGALFVELRQGVARPGVYQFSDAIPLISVISLTNLGCVSDPTEYYPQPVMLDSGQVFDFSCNILNKLAISSSWMSASKRMALGIPLHPERMNFHDWQALPGIGPRLAERIEEDRQINSDFGSVEALRRVRGIGPKRINDWKSYFVYDGSI